MSSRPGSGSESGAPSSDGPAEVRPEVAQKGHATRKKAWASRSRTGCKTCRARRVRCDEERPACQRCTKGGHECRGYRLPSPAEHAVVISGTPGPEGLRTQHVAGQKTWRALALRLDKPVVVDVDPPYWDYMQAVRFYYSCVREFRPRQFGVIHSPAFNDDTHPANFVGRQLAHYIKLQSLKRGTLLQPGQVSGFSALWSSYANNMLELIELINFFIRGGRLGGRNYIYSCLFTLMRLDLPAHWSLWHAHIRGSIAYVNSLGGATAMLESGRWYGPPLGFTRLLSEAIMFSTTTPAGMLITDYNHFTDQEMRAILLGEYDCDLPAPLDLRMAIFHINRLRHQATIKPPIVALTALVHRQLDEIEAADVDGWSAQNPVYGLEHSLALSCIFQIAIRLFALLTLPRPATSSWAGAATQKARAADLDPWDALRVAYRSDLLARMRPLFPQLHYPPNLRWPMVVAGVALAGDGAAEDREFVSQSLRAIWEQPVVACGPMRCCELLHRLWKSGKTEWEDCFSEPVPC